MGLTQFFEVIITSSETSKNKIEPINITEDILDGCKLEDEDGLIKTLTFDLKEGYTNLNKLYLGMVVTMKGGTLFDNRHLFSGTITEITPDFSDTGEVFLGITCRGKERNKLARISKDIIYPSDNHPQNWGKADTTYAEIIMNLGRGAEFEVNNENIIVNKDRLVTKTNPIRQHNKTDWAFMQFLAKQIKCTLWVANRGGKDFLHLVDNSTLVNRYSNLVLFYLARTNKSEFLDFPADNPSYIQMINATINLESKKGTITQSVNPKNGKTELTKEGENPNERWVLDENKVDALSKDKRRELMAGIADGKAEWEADNPDEISVKDYFILVKDDESSRTSKPNNTIIEVSDDNPIIKKDGTSTTNGHKENTGSRTYKTVLDSKKLATLSSEDRAGIMARVVTKELTEEDKKLYTVVDTTPKPEKEVENIKNKTQDTTLADKSDKDKDKRDSGFKIECLVYGRFDIETKRSYVLRGLGKYSNTYYLYRVIHSWGDKGWEMTLTFVK